MRSPSGYVVILTVVIGVTIGTAFGAHITNHFEGDVTIDKGAESGNLVLNDGNLGVGATPSSAQLIRAQSDSGTPAIFLVEGNNGEAVFNLKSTNGIPAVQLSDGDSSQSYRIRMGQPNESFEIVDNTGGQNAIKMSIGKNGDICIGSC